MWAYVRTAQMKMSHFWNTEYPSSYTKGIFFKKILKMCQHVIISFIQFFAVIPFHLQIFWIFYEVIYIVKMTWSRLLLLLLLWKSYSSIFHSFYRPMRWDRLSCFKKWERGREGSEYILQAMLYRITQYKGGWHKRQVVMHEFPS